MGFLTSPRPSFTLHLFHNPLFRGVSPPFSFPTAYICYPLNCFHMELTPLHTISAIFTHPLSIQRATRCRITNINHLIHSRTHYVQKPQSKIDGADQPKMYSNQFQASLTTANRLCIPYLDLTSFFPSFIPPSLDSGVTQMSSWISYCLGPLSCSRTL